MTDPPPIDEQAAAVLRDLIRDLLVRLSSGDWDSAAELLTATRDPADYRTELDELYTTEADDALGRDASVADRLQWWCEENPLSCQPPVVEQADRDDFINFAFDQLTFGEARAQLISGGLAVAQFEPYEDGWRLLPLKWICMSTDCARDPFAPDE